MQDAQEQPAKHRVLYVLVASLIAFSFNFFEDLLRNHVISLVRSQQFIFAYIYQPFLTAIFFWSVTGVALLTGRISRSNSLPWYQYLTLSATMCLSLAIAFIPSLYISPISALPSTMLASAFILGSRFNPLHTGGVLVILLGTLLWQFVQVTWSVSTTVSILLLVLATVPIAVYNVCVEKWLKVHDLNVWYLLSWISLFDCIFKIGIFFFVLGPVPRIYEFASLSTLFVSGTKCMLGFGIGCELMFLKNIVLLILNIGYRFSLASVIKYKSSSFAMSVVTASGAVSTVGISMLNGTYSHLLLEASLLIVVGAILFCVTSEKITTSPSIIARLYNTLTPISRQVSQQEMVTNSRTQSLNSSDTFTYGSFMSNVDAIENIPYTPSTLPPVEEEPIPTPQVVTKTGFIPALRIQQLIQRHDSTDSGASVLYEGKPLTEKTTSFTSESEVDSYDSEKEDEEEQSVAPKIIIDMYEPPSQVPLEEEIISQPKLSRTKSQDTSDAVQALPPKVRNMLLQRSSISFDTSILEIDFTEDRVLGRVETRHQSPISDINGKLETLLAKEERFLKDVSRVIPVYRQGINSYIATHQKSFQHDYMPLTDLLNMVEQLSLDATHLKFLSFRNKLRQQRYDDPKFTEEFGESILDFVRRTLCHRYIRDFLPKYVNEWRPLVAQLLVDSNKSIQVLLSSSLDSRAVEMVSGDHPCRTFEQFLTWSSQTLTRYVHLIRDEIIPLYAHVEKFKEASTFLEESMKDEMFMLENVYQCNIVYTLKIKYDIESLAITGTSIPRFLFESTEPVQTLIMVRNKIEYNVILFDNMMVLYRYVEDKLLKKIIRWDECTMIRVEQNDIFAIGSETKWYRLKCKNNEELKQYTQMIHSILDPAIFNHSTREAFARQVSTIGEEWPQHHYVTPIDTLLAKKDWLPFTEEDTPTNISYMTSVQNDIVIRAASLPKLVQRLTSHLECDNPFMIAFMLTYQSFTTPSDLLDMLIARYNTPPTGQVPFPTFKNEFLIPMRVRICQVLKHWIENHSYDFRFDITLTRRMSSFIEVHMTNMEAFANDLRRSLRHFSKKRDTFSLQRMKSLERGLVMAPLTAPKPRLPSRALKMLQKGIRARMSIDYKSLMNLHDVGTLEWPCIEIARQLTIIEFEIFEKIQPKELLNQSWNKENRRQRAPNIGKMIARTNQVVMWATREVLQFENRRKRAEAIMRLIKVACELRDLNNFNACKAVVGALRSIPISRLTKSWALVPEGKTQEFNALEELLHQRKSYANMRAALKHVNGACLPYLGLFLTDITFVEEGNKDLTECQGAQLINFFKRQKLMVVIREITKYKNIPYVFTVVPELAKRLRVSDDVTEDSMIELSLKLEPREVV